MSLIQPDVMKTLRASLNEPDNYSDDELEDAAFFLASTALLAAAEIGGADIRVLQSALNLVAGGVLAIFINESAIDPKKISAFIDRTNRNEVKGLELPEGAAVGG